MKCVAMFSKPASSARQENYLFFFRGTELKGFLITIKRKTHLIQDETQRLNILFLVCVLGSLSQHTLSQASLNKHTCDHTRAGRKPSGGGEILNGMQPQLVRGQS